MCNLVSKEAWVHIPSDGHLDGHLAPSCYVGTKRLLQPPHCANRLGRRWLSWPSGDFRWSAAISRGQSRRAPLCEGDGSGHETAHVQRLGNCSARMPVKTREIEELGRAKDLEKEECLGRRDLYGKCSLEILSLTKPDLVDNAA